jgi:outer membrane protein insertion porin family
VLKKIVYIILFISSLPLIAQRIDRVELDKINFIGNNSLSSSELLPVLLSKESPNWFSQLLNKFTSFGSEAVYFDSLLIPQDISAIKALYQSNGFFKTRIEASYLIDTSSSEAEITYNIIEEEPAYFRSFSIEGLNTIHHVFMNTIIDYEKPDSTIVYKDQIVTNKLNYAINFLRDNGYMLANYSTPDVIIDTMKNQVDVKIKFNTGNRYKISEVRVNQTGENINLVEDNLLKDVVGINSGNWYSNYDIQRGQVRLYRTELFTSSIVNSVISDTTGNMVPLSITAEVGALNEVSPEIIANDEESFSLGFGLSFTRKNFFGDARKFTIGTSAAIQNVSEFIKNPTFKSENIFGYGDIRATIEQPFLFGKTINTRFETYLTGQKLKDEYNSTLVGAKLSLNFELPQFTYFNSLNTYLNIENAKFDFQEKFLIDNFAQFFVNNGFSPGEADSTAEYFVKEELGGEYSSSGTNTLLGFALGTNKTDNLFFPSQGYTLSIQLEDANSIPYLFSKILNTDFSRPLFLKSIINFTSYLPIYNSNTDAFGVKFKLGNILTYKGDKGDISLNQRLYAGGSNSVRGWGMRELVPMDELLTLNDITPEDLVAILARSATTGGFFLMEGSIETRNRLIGNLGSAFFIDYGNTWNSAKEFRFDEVALAAGFGLRYYSEFAPIRIDFGFKIYDPQEKRFIIEKINWKNVWKDYLQFHIGIGEAF